MSVMKIARKHHLGAEEAQRRVHNMEPDLRQRYGLDVRWSGHHGTFKGESFTGGIDVQDDKVAIDLNLSLRARPFAGKIRQRLVSEMARALQG